MQVKILGERVRVEVIVGCLLIGATILCSCAKIDNIKIGLAPVKESFENMGAPVGYKMGKGVIGSWETRPQATGPDVPYRAQQHDTYKGTPVPLPEGQLFLFADNQFKPECCGSSVSSSTGCACITKAQMDYVNQRGGNRTLTSEF